MHLPAILRRFARDESGSITMEALLMLPLLFWILVATLVFFKAFHFQSLNVKVTYTIGDIMSREGDPITPEYMDSMFALQGSMTGSPELRQLRVTAVSYSASGKAYRVVWSQGRGGARPHTDGSLAAIASTRLPDPRGMADGQVTILTETWLQHTPLFVSWVGLGAITFQEVITTRPRAPQFCWNDNDNPSTWTRANTVCSV